MSNRTFAMPESQDNLKKAMSQTSRAMAIAVFVIGLATAQGVWAETAWQSLAGAEPAEAGASFDPLERAVLKVLTPEQYEAFINGADPSSLRLASGETLADLLLRLPLKGVAVDGLVYFPVANCMVANTTKAVDGKMGDDAWREFVVRGLTTNLSDQGGSATGCDIPLSANAIVANFRVFGHNGNGKLKAAASDRSLGAPILIRYDEVGVNSYANATVLELCTTACATDFQVRVQGADSRTHLQISVSGYFAPASGDADQVDGFDASASAAPNTLLALDGTGQLPADITGNAATATIATTATNATTADTATALVADGANCTAGQFAAGVSATGAAQGCAAPIRLYFRSSPAPITLGASNIDDVVSCDVGDLATGGGFDCNFASSFTIIRSQWHQSGPQPQGSGWQVRYGPGSGACWTKVVCLNLTP